MPLDVRLLGPFELRGDGTPLPLGGPQQRRLLAVLSLRVGSCVSLDEIVASVWPGEPATSAPTAVHSYVSRLRGVLGPAVGRPGATVLVGSPDGYTLDVPPECVDARRFDDLSARGLRALADGDAEAAARDLAAALALWRGPVLGDLELAGSLHAHRQRLAAACAAVTDGRFEAELALGRAAQLLPELLQRVAGEPLHEPAHLHLMTALDAVGRQADALQAYTDARRRFRAELGVEPGDRLRRMHEDLLTRASSTGRRCGEGLPAPLNPIVGRADDVAALLDLVRSARLVTVTGPAGAGKTRLAVDVARRLDRTLRDGACLVDLSAAVTGADVARAVALALGVLEQPQRDLAASVAEALGGREHLLVLDNCEHVAAETAQVVAALLRGGSSSILATSQEALRADGEHVYRLGPLDVPAERAAAADVAQVAAAVLFEQRVRAARRGFAITDHNAAAVSRICRELDGLPLALELAAATLAVVDVDEVAARLPDRFALLARGPRTAPPRHRSLQAAVDWSYDLLSDDERQLFHALSVFSGGFTLESVEELVAHSGRRPDVLPLLSSLVEKSFVQTDPERARFSLLETLRLHGAHRLAAAGVAAEIRDRHADVVLGLCARAAPELRGPDQLRWITRLDAERDNVAAALRWSLAQGHCKAAHGIVATLWWYWWRNGHIPEGAQWAEQVLAQAPCRTVEPALRAAVLVGASHLWWKLGAFDKAEPACREALELLAEDAEPSVLAPAARGVLAMVARDRGDLGTARDLLTGVLADYVALGEPWGEAATLNMLVSVDRDSDDLDVASARLRRSTALFADLGDLWGQAWSAWLTGRVDTRRGVLDKAASSLRHSIVVAAELRHAFGVVLGIAGVAGVAAAAGHFVEAARLLGASDAYEEAMGVPVRVIEREDSARDEAATRAALGAQAYGEHWAAGHALPQERAVQEALTCPLRP